MKDADFSVELSKTDTKIQYEAKIRKFADRLDAKISDAYEGIVAGFAYLFKKLT